MQSQLDGGEVVAMAYAVRTEERPLHPTVAPVQVNVQLIRGVVTGLVLVAPFWLAVALAVLVFVQLR